MPHTDEPRSILEKTDDTAARMVQQLLRWPCDLIDARRLMRRFQASVADCQRALAALLYRRMAGLCAYSPAASHGLSWGKGRGKG